MKRGLVLRFVWLQSTDLGDQAMDGSIHLSGSERKALLKLVRGGDKVRTARRAHVVLLAAAGWSYRQMRQVLFASNDLIADSLTRFRQGGIAALMEQRSVACRVVPHWLLRVVDWVRNHTPQDFSYFRSRWSCQTLAELLWWEEGVRRSAETVRRGLRRLGYVWRRPRPAVGPSDPDYAQKLGRIRRLLENLSPREVAVFQDRGRHPPQPEDRLLLDAPRTASASNYARQQPETPSCRLAELANWHALRIDTLDKARCSPVRQPPR